MVRPFGWLSQFPQAREIFESSHEFAQEAVAEAMSLFEGDLKSVIELFPKGTLPKGISQKQAPLLAEDAPKTSDNSSLDRFKDHEWVTVVHLVQTFSHKSFGGI